MRPRERGARLQAFAAELRVNGGHMEVGQGDYGAAGTADFQGPSLGLILYLHRCGLKKPRRTHV